MSLLKRLKAAVAKLYRELSTVNVFGYSSATFARMLEDGVSPLDIAVYSNLPLYGVLQLMQEAGLVRFNVGNRTYTYVGDRHEVERGLERNVYELGVHVTQSLEFHRSAKWVCGYNWAKDSYNAGVTLHEIAAHCYYADNADEFDEGAYAFLHEVHRTYVDAMACA